MLIYISQTKMLSYEQVTVVYNHAQELIDSYNSDARITIVKDSYPNVLQIKFLSQKHTFLVIRKQNLKYFLKILYRYLQIQ